MGREVGTNMFEARHGVMLLGEEFGIKLPRALTAFITSIGPVGAAMEAAFPFLAIAVGATLLIEHLGKMREAGVQLTQDQIKFGTATQNAFNVLDQKLLQAQLRSDELRNDHLGALRVQLELIDKQSMNELVHSFEEVAKAAETVFGDLKTSWYQFGIGSAGAKNALEQFQNQYDALLAKGKDKDASDLLKGTRESAEKVLALQKEAQANSGTLTSAPKDGADLGASMRAQIELKKSGVGFTEKEIQAQEVLVEALKSQVSIEQRISDLKKADSANASQSTANAASAQRAAAAREAAESQMRMGEQAIAGDKAAADAQLEIKRASIAERLAVDLDFAKREMDVQAAANAAEIAGLDKSSKDYANQLQAAKDKALEITQQYNTKVQELTARAAAASAAKELRDLEQLEREKIDATQKGSQARIAAINQALRQEETAGEQDTAFYRDLLNQRVEAERDAAAESAKLAEEAGREEAENAQKMGELAVAAQRQAMALQDSTRRVSEQQRIAEETQIANQEYALKQAAFARELASLNVSGNDYLNKVKELQDKETQLARQHENELTAIKEKAEIDRDTRILTEAQKFNDSMTRGLAQVIMGHESFAKMITSLGDQVVSGMIQNAIKEAEAALIGKEAQAAKAARAAYNIGISMGGPAGIVLGPVMGALAFATVSGYEGGGIVPGVGRGDVVPAMLTPGEGVIPKNLMDGLQTAARSGGTGGGQNYHVHVRPTYHVNTIDGDGMHDALEKHSNVLAKHVNREIRKLNR